MLETMGREEMFLGLVTSQLEGKTGWHGMGVQPHALFPDSIRLLLGRALIISGEPGNLLSLPED